MSTPDEGVRMTRRWKDYIRHRATARLLLVGSIIVAMAASPLAASPATAAPPGADTVSLSEPATSVNSTTCSAYRSGFSAATGSCENPASHLSFRVVAECRHVTGSIYEVTSPLVSTFDTTHAFCDFIRPDPILNWDTQIVQTGTPPPAPVIHSLDCNVANWTELTCDLLASNWTQIRWTFDGRPVPSWNNRTSVQDSCLTLSSSSFSSAIATADSDVGVLIEIKDVFVKATVSSDAGSTSKQTKITCVVHS